MNQKLNYVLREREGREAMEISLTLKYSSWERTALTRDLP